MVSFCLKFSFSLLKYCIFFYPNYIFFMIRSCLSDRIRYINYCKRLRSSVYSFFVVALPSGLHLFQEVGI